MSGRSVIVVGAGLMGVTSAYLLRRAGHEVTVLDRGPGPAAETSHANGSMLTPGMAEPWNAPGCWRVLLGSLGRADAALQLRLKALPSLVGWGVGFLRNSSSSAYQRNRRNNLRLALYSLEVLHRLIRDTAIEYGAARRGSLSFYRDEGAFDRAVSAAAALAPMGLRFQPLSVKRALQVEPALAPIADQLAGAIHYDRDETGDAFRFCNRLAEEAGRIGVQFRFHTAVEAVELTRGKVRGLRAGAATFEADDYVFAAGSHTPLLVRRAGVRVPVRPVKGYSITFPDGGERPTLRLPLIDNEHHVVLVPMDGALRLAGIAEFTGYDLALDAARLDRLQRRLTAILPQSRLNLAVGTPWCGLRPISVDGSPIVGPTSVPNLWLNTGQGHLGWTMTAGSARLLVDLMSGAPPAIDPAPYALSRFRAG